MTCGGNPQHNPRHHETYNSTCITNCRRCDDFNRRRANITGRAEGPHYFQSGYDYYHYHRRFQSRNLRCLHGA